MALTLKIKRLDTSLPLPTYAYAGDAAFDLLCREDVTVKASERAIIPTGLAMEIMEGYVGLIWDKSGLAIKNGLKTLGGVIDSGYRGEVAVGIINLSTVTYSFKKGDKVAQMIIQKTEAVNIVEVAGVEQTERGEKKFGSSGT
jgi:dUTP pyrophosphatase